MSLQIQGNIHGLAPAELRNVERLFRRHLEDGAIVSLSFARELFTCASELRRRIAVLINREGQIVEVCLGTNELFYLPELGRVRMGRDRLRKLRLVFSDISRADHGPVIPSDVIADLQKLRLDMVVGVKEVDKKMLMTYATIQPGVADRETIERNVDIATSTVDFLSLIENLEMELALGEQNAASLGANRAILVGVYQCNAALAESSMNELKELARTAQVTVLDTIIQRRTPDPRTVLGKGKLEEVVLRCLRIGAEMVIFDAELKPGQWRAITNTTELKVLDRSMLILDIFAGRAKSSDGRLQVELAQLKYNLPRLVEKDTGLSRLSGGIGGRGPGETKLEIGRRRIRDRIAELEKRIDKLQSERSLRRERRQEQLLPLVAIVGYTNAGKSTLFNALTKSTVLEEDKLFATLDPAERRLALPMAEGELRPVTVVMSDTVGFIRSLPEELVHAFRATLEEIHEAQLILHVVDAADPDRALKEQAVEDTLLEMGAGSTPRVLVLNKIDALSKPEQAKLLAVEDQDGPGQVIAVSARERTNFGALFAGIKRRVG